MSFGFSIGDIVLLSQLAYNLYESLTSGRKNASRDLAELGDVLFGLQCALDHLRHTAEDISATSTTPSPRAAGDAEMRAKLDKMVKNCANTLEDLDSATKKYREGVQQNDVKDDGTSGQLSLTRTAMLKRRLASNVMKVRWDMDKDILKVYREKLQSHTDAINIVLNTFIWSSNKDIHTSSQAHGQQLAALHDKVVSSNSELEKLVKDIHIAVMQKTVQDPSGSTIMSEHQGSFQSMPMMATCKVSNHEVNAHSAAVAPTPSVSLPTRTQPDLPPSILYLNIKRQAIAMKLVTKRIELPKELPPGRPTYFETSEPTPGELTQGLNYIFRTQDKSHSDLSKDINVWVQLLSNLVDSRMSSSTSKLAKQHADLLEFLIHLNDKLEGAEVGMRQLFYRTSTTAHIDGILRKIATSTRSVRVEQVVDEFIDVRQEWNDEQT